MKLKRFFWCLAFAGLTGFAPSASAVSLYSDWEDVQNGASRKYPKESQKARLDNFLGVKFGKTLGEQGIKILGTHDLSESFKYPNLAVRGNKELYDYSEHFPAIEIELPKTFRKFKRGFVFLSPISKRVVSVYAETEYDSELTRQDANHEILRVFSLITESYPEFGFKERALGMPPLGMMLGGSDYICARATTDSGRNGAEWDFTITCWHGGVQIGINTTDVDQWVRAMSELRDFQNKKRSQEERLLNNNLR